MKILRVGAQLFLADGRAERERERERDKQRDGNDEANNRFSQFCKRT